MACLARRAWHGYDGGLVGARKERRGVTDAPDISGGAGGGALLRLDRRPGAAARRRQLPAPVHAATLAERLVEAQRPAGREADRRGAYAACEGINVIHTPIRAPQANAYAERFVRTIRAECLDWLLILGRRHLERVLRVYTTHYNRERPHRGLGLRAARTSYHHPTTKDRQDRAPRPTRRTDPRIPPRRSMNRHSETPHGRASFTARGAPAPAGAARAPREAPRRRQPLPGLVRRKAVAARAEGAQDGVRRELRGRRRGRALARSTPMSRRAARERAAERASRLAAPASAGAARAPREVPRRRPSSAKAPLRQSLPS
jgi:Integrase core domain